MLIMRRDWTLSWCPSTSETTASFVSIREPESSEGTLCAKGDQGHSQWPAVYFQKLECLLFQQLKQASKMRDCIQGLGERSPKCLILAQIMKQLELQQYSTYLFDVKNLQKIKLKLPEWFDNLSYSKRKWW